MLKRTLLLLLGLSLVLFLFGCSDDDDSPAETETVDEFSLMTDVGDVYFTDYTTTGGNAVNVSISAVFPILADGDASNDPLILDYRSAADYATGHLTGAINISLGSLMDKIEDGTITKDKTVLNVCYTGQTASFATSILNLLGYEAENLLYGMCGVTTDASVNGTDKWSSQVASDEFAAQLVASVSTTTTEYDFPSISTSQTTAEEVITEQFKSVGASGWTISAGDVFANPSGYFVINYWPQAEYEAPGHIPGAYCFPPKSSLQKAEMLKLLPTDKTIVVYCYTGQTSAQVTAYLRMLGYDAKSLLYGVNGFAYNALAGHKYSAPADDYSAIIVK